MRTVGGVCGILRGGLIVTVESMLSAPPSIRRALSMPLRPLLPPILYPQSPSLRTSTRSSSPLKRLPLLGHLFLCSSLPGCLPTRSLHLCGPASGCRQERGLRSCGWSWASCVTLRDVWRMDQDELKKLHAVQQGDGILC